MPDPFPGEELPPARPKLTPVEGLDVIRSAIAITRAGDGLSEALKVDPAEYHHGDKLCVVLEVEMVGLQFVPVDNTDPGGPQIRVHKFRAGTASVIDPDLVGDLLDDQADRILRAREEEAGVQRLDFTDTDEGQSNGTE